MTSPTELPLSAVMQRPNCSRPSPTAMMRCDSPSHATSLRRPEMMAYSLPALSMFSGSQTRSVPAASPLATLKPLGAKRATVVAAVWPVYSLQSSGESMDRTKMDFPDYKNVRAYSRPPFMSAIALELCATDRVSYALALAVGGQRRGLATGRRGGRGQNLVDCNRGRSHRALIRMQAVDANVPEAGCVGG